MADLGTSFSGGMLHNGWPSPFHDYASTIMPRTMPDVLRYSEMLLMSNGVYRMSLQRVLSYFITDIEIGGKEASSEERDRWAEFLRSVLNASLMLYTVGMDFLTYGNSFTALMLPFRRYVSCPKCSLEVTIAEAHDNPQFAFKWSIPQISARCPHCGFQGVWHDLQRPPHDRRTGELDGVKVIRYSPHFMDILWDPSTHDTAYIWKIPATDRRTIQEGRLFHLERAPWEFVEAVANNQNILFDRDYVFHMKEDTLAGIFNRGWGIPRSLTNFKHTHYVQVLHRYNEAIAMDYVMPFRLLTPAPRPGAGLGEVADPLLSVNLGNFRGNVNRMLMEHRRDPATWHALPFPVHYQVLGGEARQLAPRELLDQGLDMLLNSIGSPVEFYKGTLTLQSAPVALRLFESTWNPLVTSLNAFLRWVVTRVAQLFSWQQVTAKLSRVTHVDDINRQMALLQLMLNRVVSPSTGLKALGINYRDETRQAFEDERFQSEELDKLRTELEGTGIGPAMSQGVVPAAGQPAVGQPSAGQPAGAPAAGSGQPAAAPDVIADVVSQMGPNAPVSLQDVEQAAQAIGDRLLSLSDSERTSQLIRLKRMHPLLHSAVRSYLDNVRQRARATGQQMVLSQQYGAAA